MLLLRKNLKISNVRQKSMEILVSIEEIYINIVHYGREGLSGTEHPRALNRDNEMPIFYGTN